MSDQMDARLKTTVMRIGEEAPAALPFPAERIATGSHRRRPGPVVLAVAVILTVVAGVIAGSVWTQPDDVPVAAGPEPTTATTLPPDARGIRPLFTRQTSDGVTIRASEHVMAPGGGCGRPVSQGTYNYEICGRPSGATYLRAEISTRRWIVREGGDVAYFSMMPAEQSVAVLSLPQWADPGEDRGSYVLVKARPSVSRVRATFDAGGSDEMEPVEGYAVLATDRGLGGALVEALDASGRVVGTARQDITLRAAPTPGFEPRQKELFTRDARDGIVIRAYAFTCPGCENASLYVEISRDGVTSVGGAETRTEEPIRWAGAGQFGVAEGVPTEWVGVRVDPAAAIVRATFRSGGIDEMVPVEGWGVLASPGHTIYPSPGSAEPHPQWFVTAETLDSSGRVSATATF